MTSVSFIDSLFRHCNCYQRNNTNTTNIQCYDSPEDAAIDFYNIRSKYDKSRQIKIFKYMPNFMKIVQIRYNFRPSAMFYPPGHPVFNSQ
jgi:hypothetical protein